MKKLLMVIGIFAVSCVAQAEYYVGTGVSRVSIKTPSAAEDVQEYLGTTDLNGTDLHLGFRPSNSGWGFRVGTARHYRKSRYSVDRARELHELPDTLTGTGTVNINTEASLENGLFLSEGMVELFSSNSWFVGSSASANWDNESVTGEYTIDLEPFYDELNLSVSLRFNSVYLDSIYYWQGDSPWSIYVGGGVAYYEAEAIGHASLRGIRYEETLSDSITFIRLVVGADYRITKSWSVATEAIAITGEDYSLTAGVRYHF